MTERSTPQDSEFTEKPFQGYKVYYSGSIKGSPEADQEFPWKLVQFMTEGGADVLSEHVAARSVEEMDEVRARRIGERFQDEIANNPEPWVAIRKFDVEWVEAATHFVGVVNAPSHGVGMEIERALLKPRLGLNFTPILCLIHEDNLDKLSNMVRGVTEQGYYLKTYKDLESAKVLVHAFLTGRFDQEAQEDN